MSKATTLEHLVASYFVQAACSNKQADIRQGKLGTYHDSRKFQPRGKAYLRVIDLEASKPGKMALGKGVNIACTHLKTLKRAKWEARWAPKYEQQIKNSAPR